MRHIKWRTGTSTEKKVNTKLTAGDLNKGKF